MSYEANVDKDILLLEKKQELLGFFLETVAFMFGDFQYFQPSSGNSTNFTSIP